MSVFYIAKEKKIAWKLVHANQNLISNITFKNIINNEEPDNVRCYVKQRVYTANGKSIGGKPCLWEFKSDYPNLCYSIH